MSKSRAEYDREFVEVQQRMEARAAEIERVRQDAERRLAELQQAQALDAQRRQMVAGALEALTP